MFTVCYAGVGDARVHFDDWLRSVEVPIFFVCDLNPFHQRFAISVIHQVQSKFPISPTLVSPAHISQLKAAFEKRGARASAADVREWINQRDTSGTGAVDFADFSRAFVFAPP